MKRKCAGLNSQKKWKVNVTPSKIVHKIHLITKCFYDKNKYTDYSILKKYRNHLLAIKKTISVTDLGSGSRVFKTKERSISKMAKNVGASKKEMHLLYRLSRYFKFNNSLELGTSLGIATQAIYHGHKNNKITTIEGCPNISQFTKSYKQFSFCF